MSSDVEVFQGTLGQTQVCYDGYIYSKKRSSAFTIRWRCIQYRSCNCAGAMTTDGMYPYKNPQKLTKHCHPPNERLKKAKDIRIKLQQSIKEKPDISVTQAVNNVLQDASEEEKANFGKIDSVKRYLRDFKKRVKEGTTEKRTPPERFMSNKKNKIANTITEIDDYNELDDIEHINLKTPNDTHCLVYFNESIKVETESNDADLELQVLVKGSSESGDVQTDDSLEDTLCENIVVHHRENGTVGRVPQHVSESCLTSNKLQESHGHSRLQTKNIHLTKNKVYGGPSRNVNHLCEYEPASHPEGKNKKAPTWHRPPPSKQTYTFHSSQCVDSEVANKVDLHSMTSSMNRARKSGSAKKVDAQEVQGSVNVDGGPSTSTSIPQYPIPDFSASTSITQLGSPEPSTSASNTHVMLPEPSPSTSGTNDAPPEVPELFESHMYISENSMSFAEEMPASIQNKEGEVGKETAMSNTCPTDKIQTPTEIMSSVKVKPLDTLQANEARSSNRTSEQNVKTANIDVSAKTLESAIQRLELVSSKLTAVSLFDSYDHFGKYVSSVLRGLPAKKVLSLKQKIISEVMQVLSQEETNSAKQGTEDSQSQNPDVGSSTKRFVAEQPQAVNLPSDPNSFALRTSVGGNVSMLYPAMYTSTPTIVAQVPFFATNIVSAASTSTLSLPDNGFITSSTPNPMVRPPLRCTKTILQCPRGRGRKRRGTPVTYSNNKRPSYETTSHTVVTPKDGTTGEEQLPKSLDEQKLQEVLKLGSRLHENSEFSERRDEEVTNEDEDLSNSQQEFEIDIEEGTELAEMKQDQQDSFETVLCEGGSDLYIKEEPPEADLTSVTATPASASSTTSAVTCNLCSERCGSREHLLAHLCSAHPGCNVAQSGYFAT